MSGKKGKLWGTTEVLIDTPMCEVHRITGVPGRQCSKHYHAYKYNMFYCISGEMQVEEFRDNGIVDTTFLGAGDYITVAPNVHHRMGFLKTTEALEVYWPEPLGPDIVRFSVGGDIGTED